MSPEGFNFHGVLGMSQTQELFRIIEEKGIDRVTVSEAHDKPRPEQSPTRPRQHMHDSAIPTRAPWPAAIRAHRMAAEPPPMTKRSNCIGWFDLKEIRSIRYKTFNLALQFLNGAFLVISSRNMLNVSGVTSKHSHAMQLPA
jgi:hypothetical protein